MSHNKNQSGIAGEIDKVIDRRHAISAVTITFARKTGEKVRILSYEREDGDLDHLSIFEINGTFHHWELSSGALNLVMKHIIRAHPGENPEITMGFPTRGEIPLPLVVGA